MRGAQRGVTTLRQATSEALPANPASAGVGGAVNTGQYKRSWKAMRTDNGAAVLNLAPYAEAIEDGRQTGMKAPPTEALARWAQRRLNLDREAAKKAAWVIGRAIKKRGLKARHILSGALPKLEADFVEELRKEFERELETP